MAVRPSDSAVCEKIRIDPAICNGRPIVKGTRITVQSILEFLAAGDSIDDILGEFPQLSRSDIDACLGFASRIMANRISVESSVLWTGHNQAHSTPIRYRVFEYIYGLSGSALRIVC